VTFPRSIKLLPDTQPLTLHVYFLELHFLGGGFGSFAVASFLLPALEFEGLVAKYKAVLSFVPGPILWLRISYSPP
jgi:hypothetical protein